MAFEVVVKGEALAQGLGTARQVVDRKVTIEVLAHALLEVEGGALRISATDLNVTYRSKIESLGGAGSGKATANVDTLNNLARSMPDATIRIVSSGDGKLQLSSEGFKSALQMLDPKDFPQLPEPPTDDAGLSFDCGAFKMALDLTRFAMTADDKRYFLNGVLVDVRADRTMLVGSDGRRVAVRQLEGVQAGTERKLIIPAKSVGALTSILDGVTGTVRLLSSENHLFFVLADQVLVSRVVDGQYPAYEKIIPGESATPVVMERAGLVGALRRLMLLTDSEKRALACSIEPGLMRLSAKSQTLGEAEQTVKVEYAGKPTTVALSGSYLLDFMEAAPSDKVSMHMGATADAIMLLEAGQFYKYALAPMRL